MCATTRNSLYFEQRMHDCLRSADRATDAAVAKVHRNFAERYRTAAKQAKRAEATDMNAPERDAAASSVAR